MPKFSDEFVISCTMEKAMELCKNAVAQLGWKVLNQTSSSITCKEVTSQATSFTFPVEVTISLSNANNEMKIILDGTIFGLGPIQSGHLKGQVGRLRNIIEVENSKAQPIMTEQTSISDELTRLADMYSKGLLSEDEFKAAKAKIIGG